MRNLEDTRRALGSVSLMPADPSWPAIFLQERGRLRPILGGIADKLQHYGSTAVPGLSAKPVIDMMAPVSSLAEADALEGFLAGAAYRMIDAGFSKRRFFRKHLEGADLAFHLHLAVTPHWPVKNELLFRDWLIENPVVARAYEALKARLAVEHGEDMPRYTESKTLFLRKAVNDARRSRGLPEEHDWEE